MSDASSRTVVTVLRWKAKPANVVLASACAAMLGACSAVTDEQIRGSEREAFLPSGRVRYEGGRSTPESLKGWELETCFEAGYHRVEGDFAQNAGEAEYSSSMSYAAFAPNMEYEGVQIDAFAGLSYGEIDVTAPGNDSRQEAVGTYVGLGTRYRCIGMLEPYARWSHGGGAEWSISRVELGFELRPMEEIGVECAYAMQTHRIEPGGSDGGARIETEGLHLGLVLRF